MEGFRKGDFGPFHTYFFSRRCVKVLIDGITSAAAAADELFFCVSSSYRAYFPLISTGCWGICKASHNQVHKHTGHISAPVDSVARIKYCSMCWVHPHLAAAFLEAVPVVSEYFEVGSRQAWNVWNDDASFSGYYISDSSLWQNSHGHCELDSIRHAQ